MNIEENIIVVLLPFTCILVVLSVFGRYTGLYNMFLAEEAIRYMYIWVSFIGISMGIKSDAHFRLVIFINMFPLNLRKYLFAFANTIAVIFLLMLTYYSTTLVRRLFIMGQRSPMLQIPIAVPYAAITFGSLSMCVRMILKIIEDLRTTKEEITIGCIGGDEK